WRFNSQSERWRLVRRRRGSARPVSRRGWVKLGNRTRVARLLVRRANTGTSGGVGNSGCAAVGVRRRADSALAAGLLAIAADPAQGRRLLSWSPAPLGGAGLVRGQGVTVVVQTSVGLSAEPVCTK